VRVAKEHLCPRGTNLLDDYENLEQLDEAIRAFNREINGKVHTSSGKIPALVLDEERFLFSMSQLMSHQLATHVTKSIIPNQTVGPVGFEPTTKEL
jgi:hypothetical protein